MSATPENDRQRKIYDARDRYARTLGRVDDDVIAPIINPSFAGGPRWPNLRQAWRVIRRQSSTAVLSDGLADAFDDDPDDNCGFAVEVLVDSPDPAPVSVARSWLFGLCYHVSQIVADHGGVRDVLDDLGLITIEIPPTEMLNEIGYGSDNVGVLLGVEPDNAATTFESGFGDVRVITATLLTKAELQFAAEGRAAARTELARRLAAAGTHHRSSLTRKSVA